MTVTVDGLGQTGTKIYPSVGALPAARLGAMVSVDDGTTGRWFVGLSVSGTATWVELANLLAAIVRVPTAGENIINVSDNTIIPLQINSAGAGIDVAGEKAIVDTLQSGATPTDPILRLTRTNDTASTPLMTVVPDFSTAITTINGSGEITARAYSPDLPAATSDHLGAIARLVAGGSGTDTFWYCGLVGSTPTWLNLQGPTGATGATGATGPAPVIGTPTVTGLSAGSSPTISQTGSGTSGDPYIDHFGIPAGATGPAGSLSFPDLPIDGASVTFAMNVLSGGSWLPWRLPAGYTFQVLSTTGQWGYEDAGTGDIWVYPGVGSGSTTCTGEPCARLLSEEHHTQGAGDTDLGDPLTAAITVLADADILLFENIESGTVPVGEIIAVVKIVSVAAGTWFSHIDFTASNGGFTAAPEDAGAHAGTYVTSTGWQANGYNSSGFATKGVFISLTLDSCTLTSIEMVGTATFSNSNPADAMIGAGGSSFLAYDTGATEPASGAQDWTWDGVTSHPSNPASPQTAQTSLTLFMIASDHDQTSGAALITGATIRGTGTKPSQLP